VDLEERDPSCRQMTGGGDRLANTALPSACASATSYYLRTSVEQGDAAAELIVQDPGRS
jgi:hypothetical protein